MQRLKEWLDMGADGVKSVCGGRARGCQGVRCKLAGAVLKSCSAL